LRVGNLHDKNFAASYQQLRSKHQQLLHNYSFDEDISDWEKEFFDAVEFLKSLNIVNGEYFINDHLEKEKKVLAEGAQGSMLDIDFGTFPYVTSSNTISAGVCSGLGIAPNRIREVIGVTKAYCTRVGSGPFPTELTGETGEELRKLGNEFGATTGRPRRCGWIDLVALRYTCMINGVTKLVMTKADVLDSFKELNICTDYSVNGKQTREIPFQMERIAIEPVYKAFSGWVNDTSSIRNFSELPQKMKEYIDFINKYLDVNIHYVSNGPGREQLVEVK
jgi:adenylosuccinate synthase